MICKEYQDINDFINNVNMHILGDKDDIYYIANSTLTRNSFVTKILSKNLPSVTLGFVFFSFIKFYLKAFILFFVYIINIFLYKIMRKRIYIDNNILIDCYFLVDRVLKDGEYIDSYFMGIDKVLDNKKYTYFIKSFYGLSINIKKFYKIIQILNKNNINIINEFDFITLLDVYKVFIFILVYPFKILKIYLKFRGKNNIFDYSLIDSLNGSDIKAYIRYLVGSKVNNRYNFKKIISWCEYQNIDKSFYKGINETKKDTVIYGCQFLVPYDSWLNFFIPKFEQKFNLTPDILLTNGKYYLDFISINKKLGVSLRYKHIFTKKQQTFKKQKYILLLGSHIQNDTSRLIEFVKNANLDVDVILRLHPTDSFDNYSNKLKSTWICSKASLLSEDIDKSFMIITNDATGTSLETVCSMKSTIILTNENKFHSIPLVEYGKGKIWDIAFNEDDVKKLYNKLIEYRKNNKSEIQKIAEWYKNNFFVEPTEENIIKAFELGEEVNI